MKDYETVKKDLGKHMRTYASMVTGADISAIDLERLVDLAMRFLNANDLLRLEKIEVLPFIRCSHPYGYRSGEWAKIVGVELASRGDGWSSGVLRPCYKVEFDDKKIDQWPVNDPDRDYEFVNLSVVPE
jgi:hypothetical protein